MKILLHRNAVSKIVAVLILIGIIAVAFTAESPLLLGHGEVGTTQSSSSTVQTSSSTDASVQLTTTSSIVDTLLPTTTTTTTMATTTNSTRTVCTAPGVFHSNVWNSSLRGVDYTWGAVFAAKNVTPPAEAFPLIKSLGFNLLRVPLSWDILEQNETAYLAALIQIASAAQSNGLYVVYTALTSGSGNEPGQFFPGSMAATYGNDSTFFTSWWEGNVTYDGVPGWTALWNDFWIPVIQTVNCYNNTLGYELENEPHVDGATQANFHNFNQVFATEMRAATAKYIVFMAAGQGMNPSLDAIGQPTNISNIVLDAHCYNYQSSCGDPPGEFSALNNYSQSTQIPVWVGEWGVDTPTANQSEPQIKQFGGLFNQYNFSNAYWSWSCNPTITDTSLLTGPNCQPFWLTYQVSQAQS